MAKNKTVNRNTIEGLVIPYKWNEEDKIVGIAIKTEKQGLYLVAHNRIESELLNHLHVKVGIKGKIMERIDGSKLIHVRSFNSIVSNSNENYKKQSLKEA